MSFLEIFIGCFMIMFSMVFLIWILVIVMIWLARRRGKGFRKKVRVSKTFGSPVGMRTDDRSDSSFPSPGPNTTVIRRTRMSKGMKNIDGSGMKWAGISITDINGKREVKTFGNTDVFRKVRNDRKNLPDDDYIDVDASEADEGFSEDEIVRRITELSEMKRKGELTEEEYSKMKRELITKHH
jgi:hypothetical protein